MSQNRKIIAGVVALVVGAILVGWLYFQLSPDAWDDFMAEMGGEGEARSASQPVVRRPVRRVGQLVASGNIEAEEVTLASEVGGRVMKTAAGEGDEVKAGDLLLQLDQQSMLAQREGALA